MPDTMADPSAPRVTADPPIAAWRLGGGVDTRHAARPELAALLDTYGLHDTPFDPTRPVVATGHQAAFWHPGILAKDLAMAVACERLGAQPVHLVVDHDTNPALTIDLPVRDGDALRVEPLTLGHEDLTLTTGQRPPLEPDAVAEAIHRLREQLDGDILGDLSRLLEPPQGGGTSESLADSITRRQLGWMRPYTGGVFVLRTARLARLAAFEALVERMLHDARRCVAAYNRAVAAVPEAGVAPLVVERDRVELPLWWIARVADGGGRHPVFADLADTTPILTRADGTPIMRTSHGGIDHEPLAPKALTLTAFMRSALCDLFIHGTGGGVYERVTERWWAEWVGSPLAPLAVVSADVTLGMAVPVATRGELDRAVWYRHHLPHNIDRCLDGPATLDPALLAEKRAILNGDAADHDAAARRAARLRLRAINRAFADQHPGLIASADRAVARARLGLANAAAAARRDWCSALYPPAKLAAMRKLLSDSAGSGREPGTPPDTIGR